MATYTWKAPTFSAIQFTGNNQPAVQTWINQFGSNYGTVATDQSGDLWVWVGGYAESLAPHIQVPADSWLVNLPVENGLNWGFPTGSATVTVMDNTTFNNTFTTT